MCVCVCVCVCLCICLCVRVCVCSRPTVTPGGGGRFVVRVKEQPNTASKVYEKYVYLNNCIASSNYAPRNI